MIRDGRVRLDKQRISSPSKTIGPGNTLTISFKDRISVVTVLACGERRGPYLEAKQLYQIVAEEKTFIPSDPAGIGINALAPRPSRREQRKARLLSGKPT